MGAMSAGLPEEEIEKMKANPSNQRTPIQAQQI